MTLPCKFEKTRTLFEVLSFFYQEFWFLLRSFLKFTMSCDDEGLV